jgi:flagellar biosynthesis protein
MDDPSETDSARKRAVALRYDTAKEQAPRVVAAGSGHIAQRILEIAREQGVTIHEDADLVQTLSALDLGMEIPEPLYVAVAEVLAFVYRINRNAAKSA